MASFLSSTMNSIQKLSRFQFYGLLGAILVSHVLYDLSARAEQVGEDQISLEYDDILMYDDTQAPYPAVGDHSTIEQERPPGVQYDQRESQQGYSSQDNNVQEVLYLAILPAICLYLVVFMCYVLLKRWYDNMISVNTVVNNIAPRDETLNKMIESLPILTYKNKKLSNFDVATTSKQDTIMALDHDIHCCEVGNSLSNCETQCECKKRWAHTSDKCCPATQDLDSCSKNSLNQEDQDFLQKDKKCSFRKPSSTGSTASSKSSQASCCIICFEQWSDGDQITTLPCVHKFHLKCLLQWSDRFAAKDFSCPICKQNLLLSMSQPAGSSEQTIERSSSLQKQQSHLSTEQSEYCSEV